MQLAWKTTLFAIINLKAFLLEHGVLEHQGSATLNAMAKTMLGKFMSKDPSVRKSERWEMACLPKDHLNYAALDVWGSRLVFEAASKVAPWDYVKYDSAPGTHVAVLVHSGGEIAADGVIASAQPRSLSTIKVQLPSHSCLLIDITSVMLPSAAAILHLLPLERGTTKAGALIFGQLQRMSSTSSFSVVCLLSLLVFNSRDVVHLYFGLYHLTYA